MCTRVHLLLLVFLPHLLVGCSESRNESHPRPSDAGFIRCLGGQRITVSRGLFTDEVWTINPSDVIDFEVKRISYNAASDLYAATVSFRVVRGSAVAEVSEAIIRYRSTYSSADTAASKPARRVFEFVDFTPGQVRRIE